MEIARNTGCYDSSDVQPRGCTGRMANLAIGCGAEVRVRPATPEILAFCRERGRRRQSTRVWEINDVEDAESRRARTSIERPSGDATVTRHVINNMFDSMPTAACVGITGSFGGDESGPSSLVSTCSIV